MARVETQTSHNHEARITGRQILWGVIGYAGIGSFLIGFATSLDVMFSKVPLGPTAPIEPLALIVVGLGAAIKANNSLKPTDNPQ